MPEYALSFRYDSDRPRVYQQILKPGLVNIGSFENDTEAGFIDKLSYYFRDRIEEFCRNSYEYFVTLGQFASHMEQIKENPKKWKAHLAVLLYEYIRGAFTFVNRNELKDVRLFHNDVARICAEAADIDFKDIFDYSPDCFEKSAAVDNAMLADLYDFGNKNVNGDIIAGVLHSVVSYGHEHDGEVPTDLELAGIVAELAKYSHGELKPGELLCDPAAGSGNLISAAISVFNLLPTQVAANDVNAELLELLSLRLGLNYIRTVSTKNSPAIYNKNIADMNQTFFENVGVIVVNPPFLAGINCVERKKPLYHSIEKIIGKRAETNVGQMPLEAVFLELIIELVNAGTTIACVFPKTLLMGTGIESQAIRQLLTGKFGLQLIFTYPVEGIFDDVTKGTCVIVGKTKETFKSIKIISSYEKIPNLDIHCFAQSLYKEMEAYFRPLMPGVDARIVPASELTDNIENGWRMLNSEIADAEAFVKDVFQASSSFVKLSKLKYPLKRGQAGNSGGSDILSFDSREELYDKFKDRNIKLSAGMRNAKSDKLNIRGGDSAFLDVSGNEEPLINEIIDAYSSLPERKGRQQRKKKSAYELREILNKESKAVFPENSVLIPRAIRAAGKVYLSETPVFVSTNFVVCSAPSADKAYLIATWMATVFYQLICEVKSKDQEGLRKMEVDNIKDTFVPNFNTVSLETIKELKKIEDGITFLNLNNPEVRDIDKIWANELFNEDADKLLGEALRLLTYLANRRNPQQ